MTKQIFENITIQKIYDGMLDEAKGYLAKYQKKAKTSALTLWKQRVETFKRIIKYIEKGDVTEQDINDWDYCHYDKIG